MKNRRLLVFATLLAGFATTAACTDTQSAFRNDTDGNANSADPVPGVSLSDNRESNWPALPERQSGEAYRQVVKTTFGVRERNFESGR